MSRILQVCNSAFYLTHFLVPLVRGLTAAGHDVECACEGPEFDRDLFGNDVPLHHFPLQRTASPGGFLAAIQRMRSLIRAGKYDCVDSHNRSASIVGRVAAWMEGVPVKVYTAHGFYFHDGQSKSAFRATVGLEIALARITDYTLSQSASDTSFMTRHGWIRESKIETIGNGIDTTRFSPSQRARAEIEETLGLTAGRFRIAATGRLVRGKGFADLLDAFARLHSDHPDTELLIIGGIARYDIEPYQTEFLERVRALGLDRAVTVTGLVGNVEAYLATTDVFVLPSYREGMPRALLEAMAMTLPVIATDIRGCREIVRHGTEGWLFPPHDVSQLAALLAGAYDDRERGRTMGGLGRQRVCEAYDEKDYVARQVAAIGRLLRAQHTPDRVACGVAS